MGSTLDDEHIYKPNVGTCGSMAEAENEVVLFCRGG